MVRREPSGWTRPEFRSKISRYRRPSPRYFCAISHRLSWNRPTGGFTTYSFPAGGEWAAWGGLARPGGLTSRLPGWLVPPGWPVPPLRWPVPPPGWPVPPAGWPVPPPRWRVTPSGRPLPPRWPLELVPRSLVAVIECGAASAWCASAGESAVVAAKTSSAAVTSRCTSAWVPPASGTRRGIPALRTAALTSAITHQTSWIQATQTSRDSTFRIAGRSSWWVSSASEGIACGTGSPNTVTSANGTPAVRATSAAMASRPTSRSPAERRRRRGAYRGVRVMFGAISRPPPARYRTPRSPFPGRSQ